MIASSRSFGLAWADSEFRPSTGVVIRASLYRRGRPRVPYVSQLQPESWVALNGDILDSRGQSNNRDKVRLVVHSSVLSQRNAKRTDHNNLEQHMG